MTIKSSDLSWIVVSDLAKAKKFFSETLGMKIVTEAEDMGWIELTGQEGGATLGIAAEDEHNPIKAGSNAVITLTVANLEKTCAEMKKKGVHLVGDPIEIPGHVKMQLIADPDGNYLQIVQLMHE